MAKARQISVGTAILWSALILTFGPLLIAAVWVALVLICAAAGATWATTMKSKWGAGLTATETPPT